MTPYSDCVIYMCPTLPSSIMQKVLNLNNQCPRKWPKTQFLIFNPHIKNFKNRTANMSQLHAEQDKSIQWTPEYTFEWKVVNKRLYKSNKNSLIRTYFLIQPLISWNLNAFWKFLSQCTNIMHNVTVHFRKKHYK